MKLKNLSILVLLAALTFSFSACGSDDEEDDNGGGNNGNSIVGVWQYNGNSSLSAKAETNNDKISAAIEKQLIVEYGDDKVYTIEFKSDGTFIDNEGIDPSIGTYTVKDGVVTVHYTDEGEEEITSTPYTVDGNKLIIAPYDHKSDYTDVDGAIDAGRYSVKNLFEDYSSELTGLTVVDFTSITKAEVTATYTRVIIN